MQEQQTDLPPPGPARRRGTRASRLRTRMTAGLILILPIWITVTLLTFVFRLMRDASLWVVEGLLVGSLGAPLLARWGVTPHQVMSEGLEVLPLGVRWGVGIFSALLTAGAIYALGMVTSNIVGRKWVGTAEALVDRLPIVKTVYRATKQVLETFTGETSQGLQRVALIPFPNERVQSVAFVTRTFLDASSGEEYCAVFTASTPNPTTGFVFLLRRRDLVELDWSVEEAIKVIMSGGVLTPDVVPVTARGAQGPRPPLGRSAPGPVAETKRPAEGGRGAESGG